MRCTRHIDIEIDTASVPKLMPSTILTDFIPFMERSILYKTYTPGINGLASCDLKVQQLYN